MGKSEGESTWKTQVYMGKNIKMDLQEIRLEKEGVAVQWIDLVQDTEK